MFAALGFAGNQPFNDWFTPDTTQRHPLGMRVSAVDPWWGGAEFMYVKAASTMERGSLVQWDNGYVASDIPNTANLGRPFGVLMSSMSTSLVYGWAMLAGFAVISAAGSVNADTAVGIGAAGQGGTNSAGKQLLGLRNIYPSTTTLAKTNTQTKAGSAAVRTKGGYDGWFLGMAISGTGIPSNSVIARLDPDGLTVYLGSAIGTVGDKNATETGSVTATGTWTGYLGAIINHPFTQGVDATE